MNCIITDLKYQEVFIDITEPIDLLQKYTQDIHSVTIQRHKDNGVCLVTHAYKVLCIYSNAHKHRN